MGIRIVPKNAQYSVYTKAIQVIAQLYGTGCRLIAVYFLEFFTVVIYIHCVGVMVIVWLFW
jgi:hypothetical protein